MDFEIEKYDHKTSLHNIVYGDREPPQCSLLGRSFLSNEAIAERDVLISNVGMIEEYATLHAHDHVELGERIDKGRDVLISNVGMIEEYAM
jgi:hypothetical protein